MDVAELWVLFNYVFVPGSTGFMLKLMFWGSRLFALFLFSFLPVSLVLPSRGCFGFSRGHFPLFWMFLE